MINYYTSVKQSKKWMLYVTITKVTKSGLMSLEHYPLMKFSDISKDYTVIVHKRDYNGVLITRRTDKPEVAYREYDNRYSTFGTTGSCIIKREYDSALKKNVYKIIAKDVTEGYTLTLIEPDAKYLYEYFESSLEELKK